MTWNNDPEVLYYSETGEVAGYTIEELRTVYRDISRQALMFIVEQDGAGVGECWLQRMNIERLKERFPGRDVRRIDLALMPSAWGAGTGSTAVHLLTEYGFATERADVICGVDIADYNMASQHVFAKNGYRELERRPGEPSEKAAAYVTMVLMRSRGSRYSAAHASISGNTGVRDD